MHLVLELVVLGLVTLHGMVLRRTAVTALGRLWVKDATAALDYGGCLVDPLRYFVYCDYVVKENSSSNYWTNYGKRSSTISIC